MVWYGWQILIPGIVSDVVFMTGLALFSAGLSHDDQASAISGLVMLPIGGAGHLFSGPIVHGVNGQSLKAVLSFLVQGVVPGGVATAGFRSGSDVARPVLQFVVLPITLVGGMAFDAAFLATKAAEPEEGPAISFAPLVVPKLHANSGTLVGVSLIRRF